MSAKLKPLNPLLQWFNPVAARGGIACRGALVVMGLGILLVGCRGGADKNGANGDEGPTAESLARLNYPSDPTVHHDDAGRVDVKLSAAWGADGLLVVRGVFSPDDPGYHLYSSDLPAKHVNGLGRPTRIDVADPAAFANVGPLVADKKTMVKVDETLNTALSVYADGPVTLYLPLRLKPGVEPPNPLPVQLTYMACTDVRCNVPVEGAVAEVAVPEPESALNPGDAAGSDATNSTKGVAAD